LITGARAWHRKGRKVAAAPFSWQSTIRNADECLLTVDGINFVARAIHLAARVADKGLL